LDEVHGEVVLVSPSVDRTRPEHGANGASQGQNADVMVLAELRLLRASNPVSPLVEILTSSEEVGDLKSPNSIRTRKRYRLAMHWSR
jgi:hypothetical protein